MILYCLSPKFRSFTNISYFETADSPIGSPTGTPTSDGSGILYNSFCINLFVALFFTLEFSPCNVYGLFQTTKDYIFFILNF